MPSAKETNFQNLPFQEKLDFLYGLPARQKRDLILASPEAERLVRSFAPETLFHTLKEIGAADAGDLLSLATPEQVRWLFDLDCWNKDQPNFGRIREWLEAVAEGGRRRMAEGLMALDIELAALILRQFFRVYRVDDPQGTPDAPLDRFVQFDEHYLIEQIRKETAATLLLEFLEEAFERDYNYFESLMEEIYWGVGAELEEQAYRFRGARLADRGFPDFYSAQEVFAYLDPARFFEIRKVYDAPSRAELLTDDELVPPDLAPWLADGDNSLLSLAITAGFAAEGKRQLRAEMAMVTNQVLVARAVDFGDIEAVRDAVSMTHSYLNLGLEHLAGGDLRGAIEHLRDTHLKLLFRLGVSLTIDLRKRAEAVLGRLGLSPRSGREVHYLDTPYREALAGFLERQPRFYGGLDGGGAVTMRDFGSMRDLHLGYAVLEQVEGTTELFRELLGLDLASAAFRGLVAGHEVHLSQILMTALVNSAMGHGLAPRAIAASRLGHVYSAVMGRHGRPASLSHEFRASVAKAIAERSSESARRRSTDFVNSCLNLLEEDLAELDPGHPIDPRFIRSLLIRADHASPS